MKKLLIAASVAALLSACAGGMSNTGMSNTGMSGGSSVMVGGAAMLPSKDIIDNAVNSKDHTTLVAAVKAAGLVDTLKTAGPFTVFAPTNAAFDALPEQSHADQDTDRPRGVWQARRGSIEPARDGRQWPRHTDHCQRRRTGCHHKRLQCDGDRRKRRYGHGDYCQCLSIERRHPRGQQGAGSQLSHSCTTKSGARCAAGHPKATTSCRNMSWLLPLLQVRRASSQR